MWGVWYHLAEWGQADLWCLFFHCKCCYHWCSNLIYIFSLANPQELFNLWHASAHNIIERMFSILKNQFAILQHNLHLTPQIQAHLPAALAAIHNIYMTMMSSSPGDSWVWCWWIRWGRCWGRVGTRTTKVSWEKRCREEKGWDGREYVESISANTQGPGRDIDWKQA